MANYAAVNYVIEGNEKTLQWINEAMLNPKVDKNADSSWEGNVLLSLGITKNKIESSYLRGFIQEPPRVDDTTISFSAEEAWNRTDFAELLTEKFPDLTIYWTVEEPGMEIYETNDAEQKYFKFKYWVDACIEDEYYDDYFNTIEEVCKFTKDITNGEVKSLEDIKKFNDAHEEGNDFCENFIYLHEFKVVEE